MFKWFWTIFSLGAPESCPAVDLKKVLSVTKHGFVFSAQRKPNARLEIYKVFLDRLIFLNRDKLGFLDKSNLLKITDCRSFSVLKTLTGYRPYSQSVLVVIVISNFSDELPKTCWNSLVSVGWTTFAIVCLVNRTHLINKVHICYCLRMNHLKCWWQTMPGLFIWLLDSVAWGCTEAFTQPNGNLPARGKSDTDTSISVGSQSSLMCSLCF